MNTHLQHNSSSEQSWQQQIQNSLSSSLELLRVLELPQDLLPKTQRAEQLFPLKIPMAFVTKMAKGDLHDPLLRQVLPLGEEFLEMPGFISDPLGEQQANPLQGLIHKYKGRVLLILTGTCAVNCRYCFRREFPYTDNRLGSDQWQQILTYLRADSSIKEVIFSGGDPLVNSDARLHKLISDLDTIPHLQRLRIHSRLPVMIPQRITPELIKILSASRLQSILVLHINHANEIDQELGKKVADLQQQRISVLNQAVLLRGVNDSLQALTALSEALFQQGILPYYLFTLDPVKGAAHFNVPDGEAKQLHQNLQANLPGYLVPRLAREIPGQPSKTWL